SDESQFRLRRTRVRIEYDLIARPASRPGNSHRAANQSKTDVVAASGRDFFHGVGRHVWHRRHRAWSRIRPREFDSGVYADSVEFADGVYDRRAVERAARGRRLLRMGAAGTRKFLGISGGMVVAGGQHFRYGHLSDALCRVFDAPIPVLRTRT